MPKPRGAYRAGQMVATSQLEHGGHPAVGESYRPDEYASPYRRRQYADDRYTYPTLQLALDVSIGPASSRLRMSGPRRRPKNGRSPRGALLTRSVLCSRNRREG